MMKINQKIHTQIRLQNLLFTVLFLSVVGLAAWLSTRYTAQFDWTAGGRNTLSEASIKVLDLLQEPVTVTSYARENNRALRDQISDLLGRYSRRFPGGSVGTGISLAFINPDTEPDKTREMGITLDGEMIIAYQGRSEKVQDFTEAAITNALQRLAQAKEQHLVFLEGHGERSPLNNGNADLGQFGSMLKRKGVNIALLNLGKTPEVPANTTALVIADPRANLLPGEVGLIQDYIKKGGNLLWLAEPGEQHGLQALAEQLNLTFLPGTIVDASTQLFGINNPTFALVAEYSPHPITANFQEMTLFPVAAALQSGKDADFHATAVLRTLARAWTETGPLKGDIRFNADSGEKEGPLNIGYALVRDIQTPENEVPKDGKVGEQRIMVMGDGDFLSNTYLGNGGNLNLGLNLVQWLSHNDQFINIPAKTAQDVNLDLSQAASGVIGVSFLVLIPALLIGSGAFIWFRRRGL